MSSTIETLINKSVNVDGYTNPVAFDSTHSVSYGYWICKQCTRSFCSGGKFFHTKTCQIKTETPSVSIYIHPEMIYVLGEKESGRFSPFKEEDIEKIKQLAKSNI